MNRKLEINLTETEEQLKALLHQERHRVKKDRIQVMYLLKTRQAKRIEGLAKLMGKHRNTLSNWLKAYEAGGLEKLLEIKKQPGKQPLILPEMQQRLAERLKEPKGFNSYEAIRQWLKEEWGRDIPYKVVHKTVRYKLKAKPKVARPVHEKRDEIKGEEFKKNFPSGFDRKSSKL